MTKNWTVGFALAALASVPITASALEKLKVYDNFNGTAIDQIKWAGLYDRAREISGKQLRLMARDYAGTTSNGGYKGVSQHQALPNPDKVTEIRATVNVTNVDVVGCPANPQVTQSRARIYGVFFNTGAGSQGSLLGDIEAQMRVLRQSDSVDAPGVLRVDAVVRRCEDSACDNVTELASADLGTTSLGQAVGLQMQWDPDNSRFLFGRDGAPPVALNYTVPNAGGAHAPFASISVRNTVPNCAAAPRPTGMIDALFDDVSINKSAIP